MENINKMDIHMKDALIKSINIVVQDADITQLSHLLQNTSILLQLIRMIEPDSRVTFNTNEENIKYTCELVNRYFGDIVDTDKIILGCELEIAKLGCLLINLTLTCQESELAKKAVDNIQMLSNDVQMYIMKMLKVVCDNQHNTNLAKILSDTLCNISENDESQSHGYSPDAVHDGSYLYGSPEKSSSIHQPSPLGRYFGSAQYLYKKVMIENTQLRKTIHAKFDERLELAESRMADLKEANLKLEKEKEHHLKKNHGLEDTISRLSKDIEYLTNEVADKDCMLSDHLKEIKKFKEEIKNMQNNMQKDEDKSEQLEQKKLLIEEEHRKFKELLQQFKDLDGQYTILQNEHLQVKESRDHMTFQVEKVKSDHSDYVSNLKEEIVKLERQCMQNEESRESLAESIRREAEITNLKTEVTKLKEEINERNKSHQKQTSQYMDQITVLLKQVEEQTLRNEGLDGKINNTEQKCKLLEKEIEKCEETAKQIEEQIQQRSEEVKHKNMKITTVLGELEKEKVKHTEEMLSQQNDFERKLKQQQQNFEDKENNQKKIVEEMKLQSSNEKGQSMQKIDQLKELVEKLQEENKASIQEICRNQNEINEKNVELDSLREISNSLKETLAKIKLDNEKVHADTAGQIESLNEEVEKHRLKTEDYQKCLEKCNKDIANLKNQNSMLEKELTTEKTLKEEEMSRKNVELDSLREISNTLKETLAKIKLDNEKVKADTAGRIESLKEEVEKHRLKTEDCQKCLEKCNKDIENLKNQNSMLEKELTTVKTVKEEEMSSFKRQNMQYMDQISVLLNQVGENSLRNDTLSSKVICLEGRCKQMETETEISIKQYSETVMAKTKEIERHASLVAEVEDENSSLSEENRLQKENNEKLEKAKYLLVEEQENLIKQISQLKSEMEKLRTLIGQKDMLIETYGEQNKDISADLEKKDEIMQELENRVVNEQLINRQISETNRSLDVQLQNANTVIQDMKKKLPAFKENTEIPQHTFAEEESFQQTFAEEDNRRKTYALEHSRRQTYAVVDTRRETFAVEKSFINPLDDVGFNRNTSVKQHRPYEPMETIIQSPDEQMNTSENDHSPLSIADLHDTIADNQDLTSNSPHRRDRRSILSLPTMQEENESSDIDHNSLKRTYSLREKKEKRRSIQSRRYMPGSTPPDRRTSNEEPGFLQMSPFVTETEDEPEVLDNMGWSRIAHLKQASKTKGNLCDDEKSRLSELQRRNTLCLPHLRSAYPMELTVSQKGEDIAETTIREGNDNRSSKRKFHETDSTVNFKKLKRDENSVSTQPRRNKSSKESNHETNPAEQPLKHAVSFDVAFEPAKASKPKITRSHASANLLKNKDTTSVSSSNVEVISKNVKQKPATQKASSTGGLKKTLAKDVNKKPAFGGGKTEGNRRLTQTLKKPSKELSESTKSTNKTDAKLSKEAKSTTGISKTAGNKFSRGDTKRSSFSRAKTRVAASLRGKK